MRAFYGSTEAGLVSWLPPDDMYRTPGSVGVPGLLTETRADPGGELFGRGPLLLDGCLDVPDPTAAAPGRVPLLCDTARPSAPMPPSAVDLIKSESGPPAPAEKEAADGDIH
mgnify:CR=1 FL=1